MLYPRPQGNFIGPDRSGTSGPGNGSNGLKISFGVSSVIGGNIPESGNIIGFNGDAGVFIEAGYGNFVRRNTFLANKGLAIDLGKHGPTPNDPGDNDTGANGLQNYPIILTARPSGTNTVVEGYLDTPVPSFSRFSRLPFHGLPTRWPLAKQGSSRLESRRYGRLENLR